MKATERLLFGFGVHGQYLLVNAEKLVVAKGVLSHGLSVRRCVHNRDIAGRIGGAAARAR